MPLFAVLRTRGPAWDASVDMEHQHNWRPHADFITSLHAEGFVVLVGPLEGVPHALLIVHAESAEQVEAQLAHDPWSGSGHLTTTLLAPWSLRLGSLGTAPQRR